MRDEGGFQSMHLALTRLIETHPDPVVKNLWLEAVHLTQTAQNDYSSPRE